LNCAVIDEESELKLISRLKEGDKEAFGEIFEIFHRRLLNVALKILRNEDAALDASQEAFLRAFDELPRWRGEARLATWLHKTVLNVCYERIRSERRSRRKECAKLDLAPSPEYEFEENEVSGMIGKAVDSLPPVQQKVFVLNQYREIRFRDIARLLGITEGGAKASFHKARLNLQSMIGNLVAF